MLSLFLVLAPPPREEAKQRGDIPEWVSPARPEIRVGYTRIWRRRTGRGGCASRAPSLRVNYAARARLLLLAAIVFHLLTRFGEASACNLTRARPRRSRFAPNGKSLARCAQRSEGMVTLSLARYSARELAPANPALPTAVGLAAVVGLTDERPRNGMARCEQEG